MRILCVDQFSVLGGGQRCLLDLLPGFLSRGWSVQAALPVDGPLVQELRGLGVQTHLLQCRSYSSVSKSIQECFGYALESIRLIYELLRICRSEKVDLLYVNGPRFLPAAACAARLLNIDLVFHCHHRITQEIAIRLAGKSLRFSRAKILACCEYVADFLRPYISSNSLQIIYNGVPETALSRPPSRSAIRRIGVIGRIEPEKGQLEFVKAARVITRQFPNCTFFITGAPLFSGAEYLQEVVEASHDLPIEFKTWQSDTASLWANVDLLVVPSTQFDATPRVILEAFSAGIPVVGFPVGGIPEIIKDGRTGFIAMEATPAALARGIERVLNSSPEEIAAVTARARLQWEGNFNLNLFQQNVCSAIEEIRASSTTVSFNWSGRLSLLRRS